MNFVNFRFETDSDGIALLTLDMLGRSMNVIMALIVEALESGSLMVRFILSTCPLVQGCFGLVSRWSISLFWHRRVQKREHGRARLLRWPL